MTAIYVKNRLPSPNIPNMTPFDIVCKSKPSVKHMRVFGCQAYILTPSEKRLKWDPKARVGIFVGYEEVSKAYLLSRMLSRRRLDQLRHNGKIPV